MTAGYVTVAEAAILLKVSADTVYRQIKCGGLPARRVGYVWRIPVSALDPPEGVGVVGAWQ
jgi:excisionase family DNA binding protein